MKNKNNNQENNYIENKSTLINDEIREAYFLYANETITERAIPHVRDGLKPVQRRTLYTHYKYGYSYNSKHRKSAHAVGAVMGEFHPHGDSSIYGAMIRMGQDFAMGHTLIDIQGNYGSIDGDPAASMRYTESRLTKIAHEFFHDIDYGTVNFRDTYDNTSKEPVLLPCRFPNLLINGSQGIAVGIASSIPPHNLGEVIDALLFMIDNPDHTIMDIISRISGPDFPTGGTIVDPEKIKKAYLGQEETIGIKSKYYIEDNDIFFTEIPYQVKKSDLLEKLGLCKKLEKIEGIKSIRDESDMNGISIRVTVQNDLDPNIIVNQIFKHTPFLHHFRIGMFALDKNNYPKLFNIQEILSDFLQFREQIIIKRCNYILDQLAQKIHKQIGYSIAFDNIDFIINTIQNNENSEEILAEREFNCVSLKEYFTTLGFDDKNKHKLTKTQIKHILELRLSSLKKIEINNIKNNLNKMNEEVLELTSIINSKEKRVNIIKDELNKLHLFTRERKTNIVDESRKIEDITLIQPEDVLVTCTNDNYIQRISLDEYRAQNRGGKGKTGYQFHQHIISNTRHFLLLFSSEGKVYQLLTYMLPVGHLNKKGKSILNMLSVKKDENINFCLPVVYENSSTIMFVFKNGNVRKNPLEIFRSINKSGKKYTSETNRDIVAVMLGNKDDHLLLATANGKVARIPIDKVSQVNSRTGNGVKGIVLKDNDSVVGALSCNQETLILTVTEKAYGKMCNINDYRVTNRGAQGVMNVKNMDKVGHVVDILDVKVGEEIIIFSEAGKSIRITITWKSINRKSVGIKLCDLEEHDRVIDIKKVPMVSN